MTTHQRAQQLLNFERAYAVDRIKPSCPAWIRDRIMASKSRAMLRRSARRAVAECTDIDVSELQRDYRGWLRDGRRVGPGSGRRADWLAAGFASLSAIARAVHELGYCDAECRHIAHVLHRWGHPQGWDVQPARIRALSALPVEAPITNPIHTNCYSRDMAEDERIHRELAAVASPTGGCVPEHVQRWILFLAWTPGLAHIRS